ncbi:MAG: cyclic nucleotide-binding domain-containing protein [Planctomycetota bacterium]|jgi:protein phosphatase
MLVVESFAQTDVGNVRKINDNAYYRSGRNGLFLVGNGAGNEVQGQVASGLLIDAVKTWGPQLPTIDPEDPKQRQDLIEKINGLFQDASATIFQRGQDDAGLEGLATTCALACVRGNSALVAHVGHNAVFHIRGSQVETLTRPHTVAEQLISRGLLMRSASEGSNYRYVLTRALGKLPSVQIDKLWLTLSPDDHLVLCSKGLTHHVSADELGPLLKQHGAEGFPQAAIELAKARGGTDNITVVCVRLRLRTGATRHELVAPASLNSQARMGHLAKIPLFAHLERHEILKLLPIVYEGRYEPGDVIVREATEGDQFFVIVEGMVGVTKGGVDLTQLGAGRHFGEVSFVDGGSRSATVTALGPTTLLTMRREDFVQRLAVEDSSLALKLLWSLTRNVSARLRSLSKEFVDVRKGTGDS